MGFNYRVITANCGNDSIGEAASLHLVKLLAEEGNPPADFFVINFQEVDFDETQKQLETLVNAQGYVMQCMGKMATHTKFSTQLHSDTGIASFIIYKKDLTVEVKESVEARRSNSRLSGSAYNKGGVVTDFIVTKREGEQQESLRVQAISGHLDAGDPKKRIIDWSNLHKAATLVSVSSWSELVNACANLRLAGYDANVRDKLENGKSIQLLTQRSDDPEVQALYRAPLANRNFSAHITYSKVSETSIEDKKRPGYAAEGMLDYVGIADGSKKKMEISTEVDTVPEEDSTKRDHVVVISPMQRYECMTEFEVVQGQIASRLQQVAPELAKKVRSLSENDEAKLELQKIYNHYLSKNGLLNNAISLHATKLEHFNLLCSRDSFLQDDNLKKEFSDTLFKDPYWCEGKVKALKAKQKLMQVFLDSLIKCQYEVALKTHLDWYKELETNITENPTMNVAEEFRNLSIKHYIRVRNEFEASLNSGDDTAFQEAGRNILKQLDDIEKANSVDKMDMKSLDRLILVAEQCYEVYKQLGIKSEEKSWTINVQNSLKQLNNLSDKLEKKPSSIWKKLGDFLKPFINIAASIIGLEEKVFTTQEKLIENVAQYKLAIGTALQSSIKVEYSGLATAESSDEPSGLKNK